MREPKRSFVGAAVFYERLSDNGWCEDTEWSSEGGDGQVATTGRFVSRGEEARRFGLARWAAFWRRIRRA